MSKVGNEKWVVADFETTTEKHVKEYGYTKVWLYAISDSNGEIINYGTSIEEFMEYCKTYLAGYIVYFHNLKFDGSYILNWILNNNFSYKEMIYAKDCRCYSSLISSEGQFYQIIIHFKQSCTVKFQDSLKLLPFSVDRLGKDFGLPVLKGKIDYDDYTVNEQTLEYVFNDVKIVALCLKEIKANGMLNMTTASSAYHNFEDSFPFASRYFPPLDEQFLIEYRQAYRGGRTQVNPLYESVVMKNVKRYDINSMYPFIMYNCELPIGNPIKCDTIGKYNFELYKVYIAFTLKPKHLPVLLKKNTMFGEAAYYTNTDGVEIMYLSSIDYQLVCEHYNITYIQFKEIWGFDTSTNIFKPYINKWYKIKNENKGAKRVIAKLMLNSLYGKFGSNCKGKSKIAYLDENGILAFNTTEEKNMRKYYLPIAIAITSYAHQLIDKAISFVGYENFVYCDTDSVHTLASLPSNMVDNTELGKFKLEGIEIESKYIRAKTYCYKEEINGNIEYTITCAGMDNRTKSEFLEKYKDDVLHYFSKGLTIEGTKLVPCQVKGGCILVPTTFTIKE